MLIKMCNPANVDFFVLTLENNPLKQQVLIIVENLLKKFPDSIELRKLNAKTLDDLGKVEEAMIVMEKIMSENEKDPAVFFYLISFYLKLNQVDKIKPIVLKLEKKFSNIPDIMTRVTMLKRSLQMLATVPQ
jgi:predicted Zn-dependent protease